MAARLSHGRPTLLKCCPCDFLLPFSGFWHRQQTLKKMNSFLTAAGAARARQRSGCDASHRSREGWEGSGFELVCRYASWLPPVVYFFSAELPISCLKLRTYSCGLATKRRSHSAPRQSPTSVPPAIMAADAEVDALKAAGNDAFKKGDFSGAVSNYDKAILLAPKNHLLYSNRSLAKHSAGDFVAAEADARKCLELAPDFMKGVYRLANAQLGQNDVDAAEDTVRKGLARDAENPELKKLVRVIKGRRDKAKRKAAVQAATGAADEARGAAGVDEATKREAQQLAERVQQHERELRETQARLGALRRETARTQITKNEIDALEENTEVYRSVGKMFLLSDKKGVGELLDGQMKRGEERTAQLTARAQFLDRRVREQTAEFQQLVKQATA